MRQSAVLLISLIAPAAVASELPRIACHPGSGPVAGVVLTVTVDASGMAREVKVVPGQDVPHDFAQRAMRAVLTSPCGQFPAQGRIVVFQVRLLPDP